MYEYVLWILQVHFITLNLCFISIYWDSCIRARLQPRSATCRVFLSMQAHNQPCQCISTPISITALFFCCFHHPLSCAHACAATGLIRPPLLTGVKRTTHQLSPPSHFNVKQVHMRCFALIQHSALAIKFPQHSTSAKQPDVFNVLFDLSMNSQIRYVGMLKLWHRRGERRRSTCWKGIRRAPMLTYGATLHASRWLPLPRMTPGEKGKMSVRQPDSCCCVRLGVFSAKYSDSDIYI